MKTATNKISVRVITAVCLTAALLFGCCTASVQASDVLTGVCGKNVTWKLEGGVLTISGMGDMNDYLWPEHFAESTPETLRSPFRDLAFSSVVVEEGVTSVGDNAFEEWGCSQHKIQSISLPSTLRTIGDSAFYNTKALETVVLPDALQSIRNDAFEGSMLQSVRIPRQTSYIGSGAFLDCQQLRGFTVENGNPEYRSQSGVLYTADKTGLIAYPAGKIATDFSIPDSVTWIDGQAFWGCKKLHTVAIPNSVEWIGIGAFMYCSAIRFISLPEGVKEIESDAFFGCEALQSITIPKSVKRIGGQIVDCCDKLTDVYYNGTPAMWSQIEIEEPNETLLNANLTCKGINAVSVITKGSGTGSVSGAGEYPTGTTVTLTAQADEDSVFDGWYVGARCVGTDSTYTFIPTDDIVVCAAFSAFVAPQPVLITVEFCTLFGSIAMGNGVYDPGETVTLTAQARGKESFGGWKVNGRLVSTENPYSFTAQKDLTVQAVFVYETLQDLSIGDDRTVQAHAGFKLKPETSYTYKETLRYTYTSSDPRVATVDQNGNVTTLHPGEARITVTATDEYGNALTRSCTVTVRYTWWQWLIVVFLLGWVWY